jgi:hypothetical protein
VQLYICLPATRFIDGIGAFILDSEASMYSVSKDRVELAEGCS